MENSSLNGKQNLDEKSIRKGRRKTKAPCDGCGLHLQLCICNQIPRLEIQTRVVLVIHAKELKRTTNSGQLALKALPNSLMKVRGQEKNTLDLSELLTDAYQSLLLFPSEDAIELTAEWVSQFRKPIQLFVPDGNWRQASKVNTRHPELADLPRVMIRTPNLAAEHLRAESSEYGRSTLEAVAKALGLIELVEGPKVEARLMELYQAKLQNTLKGRGSQKGDQ